MELPSRYHQLKNFYLNEFLQEMRKINLGPIRHKKIPILEIYSALFMNFQTFINQYIIPKI